MPSTKKAVPKLPRSKPPTLADVAREAGVGTTTVSRILNGGHYVEAGTMARVKAVIDRLNYMPNHAARALKGERSHTIGLIVPSLRDEFFSNVADRVQAYARQKQYVLLVLASADDSDQEIREISVLQSYRVDGAILVPPRIQTRAFLAAVRALSVPVVAVDRPLLSRSSSVTCDNYEAAVTATQHLIDHGRTRILCAGGDPKLYTIQERERGYRDAMVRACLSPEVIASADEPSMRADFSIRFSRPRNRPDAVFCSLNVASIAAYEELAKLKLRIPKDVALVGFDDLPSSELIQPPMTVIRQPTDKIGHTAARLIFEGIESPSWKPRALTFATELIQRRSCGCKRYS